MQASLNVHKFAPKYLNSFLCCIYFSCKPPNMHKFAPKYLNSFLCCIYFSCKPPNVHKFAPKYLNSFLCCIYFSCKPPNVHKFASKYLNSFLCCTLKTVHFPSPQFPYIPKTTFNKRTPPGNFQIPKVFYFPLMSVATLTTTIVYCLLYFLLLSF